MPDTDTTPAASTTTTAPTLPAALPTSGATESQIVSTINDLIAFVGTLPTTQAALTTEQTDALQRVTAFFG